MKRFTIIALIFLVIIIIVVIMYFNDPINPNPSNPTYQEVYNAKTEGGDEKANPLKELVHKSFESKVHYLRSVIDHKSEDTKFGWGYKGYYGVTRIRRDESYSTWKYYDFRDWLYSCY